MCSKLKGFFASRVFTKLSVLAFNPRKKERTPHLRGASNSSSLLFCWECGNTNGQFLGDAHSSLLEFRTARCLIICRGLFLSQVGTRVTGDAPALRHRRAGSTTRHPNCSDSTSRGKVKIWLLAPGWASLLPPPCFDLTLIPSHSLESAQVGGLFPGWTTAAPRTDLPTLNYPWAP